MEPSTEQAASYASKMKTQDGEERGATFYNGLGRLNATFGEMDYLDESEATIHSIESLDTTNDLSKAEEDSKYKTQAQDDNNANRTNRQVPIDSEKAEYVSLPTFEIRAIDSDQEFKAAGNELHAKDSKQLEGSPAGKGYHCQMGTPRKVRMLKSNEITVHDASSKGPESNSKISEEKSKSEKKEREGNDVFSRLYQVKVKPGATKHEYRKRDPKKSATPKKPVEKVERKEKPRQPPNPSGMSVWERLNSEAADRKVRRAELESRKAKDELSGCSFAPPTSSNSRRSSRSSGISNSKGVSVWERLSTSSTGRRPSVENQRRSSLNSSENVCGSLNSAPMNAQ